MLLRASISQTSALAICESRQGESLLGAHGLLAGPTSVRRVLSCLQTVGPDSSHAPAWEPCRGAPTRSMGAIKARTTPLEDIASLAACIRREGAAPTKQCGVASGFRRSAALGAKLLALLAGYRPHSPRGRGSHEAVRCGIWILWERRPRREASGFTGRLSPAFAAKACFPRACGRCSEGWMTLGATHHQATNQRDEHTEHPTEHKP